MYRILTASKDAYITNKIINNKFRATDANVGLASTLDLFKLYNENTLQPIPSNASTSIVVFSAGGASYSGKTLILIDSSGKTVTLSGGASNARTTEGAGTFASGGGVAATTIADNIVAAFDAIRAGDTTKIDMTASSASGSGIVIFRQKTAGSAGNTVISGTTLSDSLIRNSNSEEVTSVTFTGGSPITNKNYELSRILVKFDLNPLRKLTSSFLDINSSQFKATLKLSDVYGGQTTPSNFKVIVFPLSKSFDEGIGRNIVNFTDLDSCNFVTASVSSGTPDVWFVTGAQKQGLLGSDNIDIISSGNLNDGNGLVYLYKEQVFTNGEEDLRVDVTNIISGTLKNLIPDCGFRVSFTGSEETDDVTRFVKRFASLQSSNYLKKPSLIIQYNDTLQDHHRSFFFNISGSIFLNNGSRSIRRNLLSGSVDSNGNVTYTTIEGLNCLLVNLKSGSYASGTLFQKWITGSQYRVGQNFITGVYSASFALSEFENSTLFSHVRKANSASFKAIWTSMDESYSYLTSSLVIKKPDITSFDNDPKRLLVHVTNMQPSYRSNDKVRFRVFVEDIDRDVIAKKLPMYSPSLVFTKMYYRIRDAISSETVIPFDTTNLSTLCSTDSDGMYFDFYMDSLEPGRLYTIDFLISDTGEDLLFNDVATKFRLES
tara:strand:+ start:17186 stop:19162 length:1977 start_codon:yes stop_codon:yes gene_type:complete